MVIGHELWATYFNGDPTVIGKTYTLSDEPFTVIGVMPPGFAFESRSQVWLAASRYLDPRTGTSLRFVNVMARLAPGATPEQLAGELRTLEAAANDGRPEKSRVTFRVSPLRDRYVTATRGNDVVFAAIVGAILVIGCANVASLVLVRAMRHQRALAIRSALGASKTVLTRFLFSENLVLCVCGLVLGLALAAVCLRALQSAAPLQTATRVAGMEYRLDARAAAFSMVLAAITAGVLSLVPVRLLVGDDLQTTLRGSSATATVSRGGHRVQQTFVVVQTACAVALLVATALMVKTLSRLSAIGLGYDAEHVAYVTAIPVHSGRTPGKYLPAADRLLADIAALPDVDASALRMQVPFVAGRPRGPGIATFQREADDALMTLDAGRDIDASLRPKNAFAVSAEYFRVMGIPFIGGRAFTVGDNESSPAVAILNEWAARHWWPNENAVGRTFTIDTAPGIRAAITVVGVVRDNLAGQPSVLVARPGPEVYRPFKQSHFWVVNYYAKTRGSSARVVEGAKTAVMRAISTNGRPQGGLLSAQVSAQLQTVKTNALQIAGFAMVGLLLAITGLYGVMSYVVQERTREIGIRGVLGARPSAILGMVISQAFRLSLVGIVAGLLTAMTTMRLFQGLLYGTPTSDVAVYATVAAIATLVTLIASYVPAHRASRVDPIVALKAL